MVTLLWLFFAFTGTKRSLLFTGLLVSTGNLHSSKIYPSFGQGKPMNSKQERQDGLVDGCARVGPCILRKRWNGFSSSDGEGRRIQLLPVTKARVYEASRVTVVVRKSEVSLDGRKMASFLTKHVITSTCPSNRWQWQAWQQHRSRGSKTWPTRSASGDWVWIPILFLQLATNLTEPTATSSSYCSLHVGTNYLWSDLRPRNYAHFS